MIAGLWLEQLQDKKMVGGVVLVNEYGWKHQEFGFVHFKFEMPLRHQI